MMPMKLNDHSPAWNVAMMGLLGAILMVAQMALAFLPNIEVVSLLIIVYALVYGKQSLWAVYTFVLLQGLLYGFNMWWACYLYIWPVLTVVTLLLKKNKSVWIWAIVAGLYGLGFGALYIPPYLITSGVEAAIAFWVAGIPYDLLHCAGNFVTTLVLFKPVYNTLRRNQW